jgi:hypothetical protein
LPRVKIPAYFTGASVTEENNFSTLTTVGSKSKSPAQKVEQGSEKSSENSTNPTTIGQSFVKPSEEGSTSEDTETDEEKDLPDDPSTTTSDDDDSDDRVSMLDKLFTFVNDATAK